MVTGVLATRGHDPSWKIVIDRAAERYPLQSLAAKVL
jgi:hypothetical protein